MGKRNAAPKQARSSLVFWRGLTKACPACGQRGLFHRWFTLAERCPQCGLAFERIEGHWSGSLGVNTIVSFAVLLMVLAGGMVATFPEFPVVPLVAANVAVAVFFPLLFFPTSKTLWTAIDVIMRPLDRDEVDWTKVP